MIQIVQINAVKLAQLQIDKTPSLRRTVLDDRQILRREKDNIQQSQQVSSLFDLLSVDRDPFGSVFSKMHVNAVLKPVLHHMSPDMCLVRREIDDILILTSLVGFCRGRQEYCLQDVRLSLGVIAVEDVRATVKINGKCLIIPKIFKFQ